MNFLFFLYFINTPRSAATQWMAINVFRKARPD